jgi:hypothetical protein
MIVEFFAPSGTGKTRLLNGIIQKGLPPTWHVLTKYALNENAGTINPPDFDQFETVLLEMRLANLLQRKITPLELYHLVNLAHTHMAVQVSHRRKKLPQNLLLDEHLFQLFLQEIFTLIVKFPSHLAPLLQQRAVVFVTNSEEKIMANIKSRARTSEYKPLVADRTDNELLARMRGFQSGARTVLKFLKTQNVPVLEIDLSQSDGVDATSLFIQSLSNRSA